MRTAGGGGRGRGSLRIISGVLRGRRLVTLPGDAVRPTSDRAREALFDILGPRVAGSRFLDLCAGTGAVGIEALSREAGESVFIESDRQAAALVRRNLEGVGLPPAARPGGARAIVLECDVREGLLRLAGSRWTSGIAFVDPPYGGGALDRALRLLADSGVLEQGAIVAAEHDADEDPPETRGLEVFRSERYGRTGLSFYRGPVRAGVDAAEQRPL